MWKAYKTAFSHSYAITYYPYYTRFGKGKKVTGFHAAARFKTMSTSTITFTKYSGAVLFGVSVDYLLGHSDIRNLQEALQREADANPRLDVAGLPQEAIDQVAEYIEFIKHKYNVKEKSDRQVRCEAN